MLKKGEKIHVIERRYFPCDIRRHFCGEVIEGTDFLIRATGYIWVLNTSTNKFIKKPEKRERIFCLGGRLTVNVIPNDIDIDEIKYSYDSTQGHFVTDGGFFSLNISEFGNVS